MIKAVILLKLTEELKAVYPDLAVSNELAATMINAIELTGNKFIMIIDEWDAPIRENPSVQQVYLEFLRSLFKSSQTIAKIFAAAYMTGILPIKKDGHQWSTPASIKSNASSFKKFYKCMMDHGKIEKSDYVDMCEHIKEKLPEWQADCAQYNDPDCENPFEAFF